MDEELCILVQERLPLYDLSDKDYDNIRMKDNIWREIGAKLHKTPEECKKQWGLLRSYFVRARARRKTTTGQTSKKMKKWRLEDQLQFLIPFLQERETVKNVSQTQAEDEEEDGQDNEEEALEAVQFLPTSPPSPGPSTAGSSRASSRASHTNNSTRKRTRHQEKSTSATTSSLEAALCKFISSRNKTNPAHSNGREIPEQKKKLMTFFEDIAESLMNFPDVDRAETKSDIFNLVNKKEIEILKRNQATNQAQMELNGVCDFPATRYLKKKMT